jgi:Uma2 family endonuclease
MTKAPPQVEIHPVVLQLKPVITLTDDQLFQLCQLKGDWRIEYRAQGELIVMPPTGGESSNRHAEMTFHIQSWTR